MRLCSAGHSLPRHVGLGRTAPPPPRRVRLGHPPPPPPLRVGFG